MDESNGWGVSRYAALLVVVALHLALIAALMMTVRPGDPPASTDYSVQLLYLPPMTFPRVRSEIARPRRLRGDLAVPIPRPIRIDMPSPSLSPRPAAAADGNGLGVDWAAEARRAQRAFEIRNYQPPSNKSVSLMPWEDNGWPPAQHQTGDRFKNANGDWMVWINASCYQLAISGPKTYAVLPQTICLPDLRPKE
ncbi:MAG: hypothetical protein ACLPX1_03675 [Steroidobacteraceae bacterium]